MSSGVLADSVEPKKLKGSNTLENKLGVTDPRKLRELEAGITYLRSVELFAKPRIVVPYDFGFEHLKAIHVHLFSDIYEWAGKPRSFDMAKSNDIFTPADQLSKFTASVFSPARKMYELSQRCDYLPREEVVAALAKSLGLINQFHPFPEGNGRAQRVFIYSLAIELGYSISWEQVPTWEMIEVCRRVHEGNYRPMEMLIARVLELQDMRE